MDIYKFVPSSGKRRNWNQYDIGDASHRFVIGLRNSHYLLNQSKPKVKLIAI